MNNVNTTIITDPGGISHEDLLEEYEKLASAYLHLKKLSENEKQQIYDLSRSLKTASAAESYLSQELEQITNSQSKEIDKISDKHATEVEELRTKQIELQNYVTSLEQTIEDVRSENGILRVKVVNLENAAAPAVRNSSIGNDSQDKSLQLEQENLMLMGQLDEFQEQINKFLLVAADKERQTEILKEQVECLQENLQSKRGELEETAQLLESTQQQLNEMSAELAMLKLEPENINRKGNSLFGEVADQREVLLKKLVVQKTGYDLMKKKYTESQQEIRRIKRENVAMYKELQICSSLFLSADKIYKEKLNERILQLLKQNEDLERKLAWTQERLVELANKKDLKWLDSMLMFCKQETHELKENLHGCRMQKGLLEENLRNTQQELAKWRFEALKSRCIIINRESLLEQNNIPFKGVSNSDLNLTAKDFETASPQILCESTTNSPLVVEQLKKFKNVSASMEQLANLSFQNSTPSSDSECGAIPRKNFKLSSNTPKTSRICDKEIKSTTEPLSTHSSNFQKNRTSENISNFLKDDKSIELERKTEIERLTNGFDIYEDSTQKLPIVSKVETIKTQKDNNLLKVIDNSENTLNKATTNQKLLINQNFNCENSDLKQNDLKNLDGFEVYEDTTQNIPLVKSISLSSPSQVVKKKSIGNKENFENSLELHNAGKTGHSTKDNVSEATKLTELKPVYTPKYREISFTPQYYADLSLLVDSIRKKRTSNRFNRRQLLSAGDETNHNTNCLKEKNIFENETIEPLKTSPLKEASPRDMGVPKTGCDDKSIKLTEDEQSCKPKQKNGVIRKIVVKSKYGKK